MGEHHHHHRTSRSRSPQRHHHHEAKRPRRHRSRSPQKSRASHAAPTTSRAALPFNARAISKHDLSTYRPMFALYLDIQKQKDIDSLDEHEVRGRWKSFVGKWNRGELAEGWYEPQTLEKARVSAADDSYENYRGKQHEKQHDLPAVTTAESDDVDDDDDAEEVDFGPAVPRSVVDRRSAYNSDRSATSHGHGVSIPSLQDLRERDEQGEEDAAAARNDRIKNIRQERVLDRRLQKERLDETAPRAEAGTRERQLEKKREKAESNRAFAASKGDGGDVGEVRDADLMGGDEDGVGELKRMQKENERRKNEREIRKEEILRARRAEREARSAALKEKEDRTMAMLKEIAKARFGGGGGGGE